MIIGSRRWQLVRPVHDRGGTLQGSGQPGAVVGGVGSATDGGVWAASGRVWRGVCTAKDVGATICLTEKEGRESGFRVVPLHERLEV